MKVLTATPYTYQGVEIGFCDCEPGELVRLGETHHCLCYRDQEDEGLDDDVCECRLDADEDPPFVGLVSLAGTTTARVEERDLADGELRAAVRRGLQGAGWLPAGLPEGVERALLDIEIARIQRATSRHAVGALISSMNDITFQVDDTSARVPSHRRT